MESIEKQIHALEKEMENLESSGEYEAVMELMDKIYELEKERDKIEYEQNSV